jgi:general secretion pathway protein E
VDGENVVMRLLRPNAQILGFEELGMNAGARESFGRVIESPNGMVLVTGPTGSGKTSTLYTALSVLNTPNRNIMTIEDPVEIRLAGVRQIQVNSEIGMTFAGALRSMLRQDPDVVLVGEIRDEETALIASQASLTGHLVLSTMHTNDASGAVSRLRNLGVPGFVVSASLLGVMAQRLVRRICTDCAAVCEPDPALARRFGVGQGDRVMRGGGCPRCSGAGFRGRTGIYEFLPVTPEIAIQIEENAPAQQLQRTAREHGMKLMWEDGLEKALRGMTTLEEVAKAAATMDLGAEKGMRLSA